MDLLAYGWLRSRVLLWLLLRRAIKTKELSPGLRKLRVVLELSRHDYTRLNWFESLFGYRRGVIEVDGRLYYVYKK